MKIFKWLTVRIIPIAIMAFIVIAAIAYQRGVYDLTFVDRPEPPSSTDSGTEVTDTPTDTDAITDTDTSILDTQDNTDTLPEMSDIENFIAPIYSIPVLFDAGYIITDTQWGTDYAIGRVIPTMEVETEGEDTSVESQAVHVSVELPYEFSLREREVEVPERIPDEEYSGYTTEMKTVTEERPAIEVYMDYVIVDRGEYVDILSADGTLLTSDFDIGQYKPAYTRDKYDRPLFKSVEPIRKGSKYTTTKYYYLNDNGELKVASYNDKTDGRGLYINYPSYFGKTDNAGYNRYYSSETELYGYANANGHPRTDIKFTNAFNFSEGLAAVEYENGFIYFVNTSLHEKVISGTIASQSYRNASSRRVFDQYVMPDTFGEESIGFFYFDHGLVRVRRQIIDAPHYEMHEWREIASDEDIIIRADGTEFPIPTDYTALSYSNGMILLSKNGKYGYMDHTGKWVVQPTLDGAKPFNEGLAVIESDGKMGLINTKGEYVIPTIFDYIGTPSGGIIPTWDESCGWILFSKVLWDGEW